MILADISSSAATLIGVGTTLFVAIVGGLIRLCIWIGKVNERLHLKSGRLTTLVYRRFHKPESD